MEEEEKRGIDKVKENFAHAMNVSEKLGINCDGSAYFQITLQDGQANVSYFPSEGEKAAMAQKLLRLCSRVEKDNDGLVTGRVENTTVRLYRALTCEIVGEQVEKREIMRGTGEFEEIKTPIKKCSFPFDKAETVEPAG